MKDSFNKIKTIITSLWIATVSFSSKVIGTIVQSPDTEPRGFGNGEYNYPPQGIYGVPNSVRIIKIAKSVQILIIPLIFIIGTIILIKMKKIDNKTKGQKTIKWATITILSILTVAILIRASTLLLKKYTA